MPANFVAATMRSASRPSKRGQPVSISSDFPSGVTKSVAWPPSTSTKYICNVLLFSAAGAENDPEKSNAARSPQNAPLNSLVSQPLLSAALEKTLLLISCAPNLILEDDPGLFCGLDQCACRAR